MAVTTAAVWGLPPSAPGTGLAALSYAVRHLVGVSRPRGGSGRLGEALRSALEEAGGRVSTGWRVARIDPDGPAVESRDGRRVAARVVVSAICPRRTFDLLGPARPADRLRRAMGEPVEGYQSKIDAVVGRLPDLDCFTPGLMGRLGMASPLVPSVVIAPSIDRMEDIARLRSQGRMAERPMMLLNIPSVLDPTMRPDGAHVLSLEVLFTPYRLEGGWNPSVPERWLAAFGSLAGPRFRQSVIDWRAVTPLDYERDFGLTRGNPPAFAGSPLDVLRRPGPLTRYATPWPGLYLTGAGTYPGGGVWGAAGRNAALRVLRDLR